LAKLIYFIVGIYTLPHISAMYWPSLGSLHRCK